jgi:hypothetical protein
MKNLAKSISVIALTGGMGGCVSTSEMEVTPNVVMVQSEAGGALFAGKSGPELMKKAAEATLQHGYTCFALSGAQLETGSQYAGSFNTAHATIYGNSFSATGFGSGFSSPIYRHVEKAGATVTMSNKCDSNSFRAADILKREAQS